MVVRLRKGLDYGISWEISWQSGKRQHRAESAAQAEHQAIAEVSLDNGFQPLRLAAADSLLLKHPFTNVRGAIHHLNASFQAFI
jgi:hypothetical protein